MSRLFMLPAAPIQYILPCGYPIDASYLSVTTFPFVYITLSTSLSYLLSDRKVSHAQCCIKSDPHFVSLCIIQEEIIVKTCFFKGRYIRSSNTAKVWWMTISCSSLLSAPLISVLWRVGEALRYPERSTLPRIQPRSHHHATVHATVHYRGGSDTQVAVKFH